METFPKSCEQTLSYLKDNLVMDQNCMKWKVDKHWFKISFNVGDLVFLHIQPYKKTSLEDQGHQNLTLKFYGPYPILHHIIQFAYTLDLSASSKIHPIFHMSCINKVVGLNYKVQTTLPKLDEEGSILFHPKDVLHIREW